MGASPVNASVNAPQRSYLDHAATSWPKPEAVYVAMDKYAREVGAAAGRGDYQASRLGAEAIASCRRRLMELVNAPQANDIAFFSNGTAALNAAILGSVRAGDHVVTSAIEHNSVLRPLADLQERGVIRLDIVDCDHEGYVDLQQMLDRIDDKTAIVALAHASNVTGAVQDVGIIGARLRDTPTIFLCDAAQTLGYLPVDVRGLSIDLLAAPGHKGACGPLGTGMLYVSSKASSRLKPTTFGGTGSVSESLRMPSKLPEMLEAGNLNVPAIAGWLAGLEYLRSLDVVTRDAGRLSLCQQMTRLFFDVPNGFAIVGRELPIASFVFDDWEPGLVGALLDSEFSIDVRCGLHCAALVHRYLQREKPGGVGNSGAECRGTLRLSAGHFTRIEQIDAAAAAINDLVSELSQTTNNG